MQRATPSGRGKMRSSSRYMLARLPRIESSLHGCKNGSCTFKPSNTRLASSSRMVRSSISCLYLSSSAMAPVPSNPPTRGWLHHLAWYDPYKLPVSCLLRNDSIAGPTCIHEAQGICRASCIHVRKFLDDLAQHFGAFGFPPRRLHTRSRKEPQAYLRVRSKSSSFQMYVTSMEMRPSSKKGLWVQTPSLEAASPDPAVWIGPLNLLRLGAR